MTTDQFYSALPARKSFAAFSDPSAYAPLPDDWTLFLSDVVGSTEAIADGRYKAVNMAGAATIMAACNAAPNIDAPYMFGGDGAVVAMPDAVRDVVSAALAKTSGLIADAYGLDLRVAAFPMAALRREGGDISVQKYAVGETARLANFSGPGIALTDDLIRDSTAGAPYRITPSDDQPDLEGLSCRWEPLESANGVMLTLIATAQPTSDLADVAACAALRTQLQSILGGDEAGNQPVSEKTLRFRFPPRGIWLEALARTRRWPILSLLPILAQTLGQLYAQRFKTRIGPYNAPVYRQEMISQTDFRKFDGNLRMVLDVTPGQADAIEAMLEARQNAGDIFYGVHRADAALMTCIVFDLAASDHVHFIDGADGGFSLAAANLKQQIDASRNPL